MITIYVWATIGGLALMGIILWKWYFTAEDYDDEETHENEVKEDL